MKAQMKTNKRRFSVGSRVCRVWREAWGEMPSYYSRGTVLACVDSRDNRGRAKPAYRVRWDGGPDGSDIYSWLDEELAPTSE